MWFRKVAVVAIMAVVVGEAKMGPTQHIFSSSGDIARVFGMEREMVKVLKRQKERLEEGLDYLHSYTKQVDEMYEKEDCSDLKCDADYMMEHIVGNPIYSYQLLKRMYVYLKNVESALRDVDTKSKLGACIHIVRIHHHNLQFAL